MRFRLVEDNYNIKNQLFCTFNGIRMWAPFFVYFVCRLLNSRKIIAYYAFSATVAVVEFFIDNPFISVMTSLSVSQFWNLGLMQVASITGVVGVSFIVTLFACIVNFIWESGLSMSTLLNAIGYGIVVVIITGVGMININRITTGDKTIRVATCVDNLNMLGDEKVREEFGEITEEKVLQASFDGISERAKEAVFNKSSILVFPEDAFACSESNNERFLEEVERFVFRKLKIYGLDEKKLNKDDPNVKDAFCYQVRHFLKYGRDGEVDKECWETLQNSGYVRFISF